MRRIDYRRMAMMFGGILIATLAVGCFGGGPGYSSGGYGYSSSYNSYGSSYPYSGYRVGNSYNTGYQGGVRADANRGAGDRMTGQRAAVVNRDSAVARTETTHSNVDRTEKS
jgi:hypothetical protein